MKFGSQRRSKHATPQYRRAGRGRLVGRRWLALLAPVAALAVIVGGLYAAPALAAGTGVLSVTETFVNTTTGAPITQVDPQLSAQYRIDVSFSCSVANCDNTTVAIAPNVKDPYYNQFILESAGYSFTPPFPGATATGSPAAGITVNLGNLTAGQNGVFQLYYTVQNRPGVTAPGSPGSFFPNGFVIPSQATINSTTASAPVVATASATWISRTAPPVLAVSAPASTRTDTPISILVYGNAGCISLQGGFTKGNEYYQCAKSWVLTAQLPADAQYVAGSGGTYDPATRTVTWAATDTTAATVNAHGTGNRGFQVTFPSSALPTTGAGCVAPETFTANLHMVLLDGTIQDPAAQTSTTQAQNCAPFSGMTTPSKASSLNAGTAAAPVVYIPATGQAANSRNWGVTAGNTANVAGVATITDTQLDQPDMPVYQVYNSGPATFGTITYTLKDSSGTTTTGSVTSLAVGASILAGTGKRFVSVTATSAPLAGPNVVSTSQSAHTDASISFYYTVSAGATPAAHTNTATVDMSYPGYSLTTLTGTASRTVTLQATPASNPNLSVGTAGPTVTGGGTAVTGSTVTWGVNGSVTNAPNNTSIVPQYVFVAPPGWNVTSTSWSVAPPVGTTVVQRQVTISGQVRNVVVATWPAPLTIGSGGSSGALPTLFVVTTPTSAAVAGTNVAIPLFGDANRGTVNYANPYTEAVDLAGDGTNGDKYSTANLFAALSGTPSLSVLKEICRPDALGNCTWIANSNATVGVPPTASSIKYRITVTNTGQAAANNVTAYDVLPYIGDTGTSDATASAPRGSTVRETLNSVSGVPSDVTLAYSTSSNPPRPGVYSSATTGAWTDPAAGSSSLRATIATLAAGASRSFTYDAALVGGAADQTACNSVAVIATSLTAVEPAAVCATTQQADMSVTTASRFPLQVGRVGTVPFVVNNGGGSQLATGTVTLDVPGGLTIASLNIPNWSCSAPSMTGPVTVTCNPVDSNGNTRQLLLNTPETISLQVTPDAAAVWSVPCISASVTGIMNDPDLTNNSASACSTVVAATTLLSLTKTDGVTTASPGQTLTYTITAANGIVDQGLTGVTVTDHLPANVQWVSGGTVSGQDTNGLGGTVTFTPANLNAAGTATATGDGTTNAGSSTIFTVTVRVAAAASGTIVNTVDAAATDPVTTLALSASAGDTDQLQRLTVTKSSNAPAAGVRAGDTVTYTVRLTNDGTTAYTAGNPAKVLDDASGALDDASYVSGTVSVDGGASSGITPNGSNHIVWSGALPAGSVATIAYSVTVGSGGDKLLANTAYASGQVGTSCTAGLDQNGISCATVQSAFAPSVNKVVQSLTQNNDGTWTIVYAVTVTNPSPTASSPYSLTDSLRFGTGIQVLSATAAIPSGATAASPAWSGSGVIGTATSIPANSQQAYIVTVVADAHAVAGTAAATCVTHAAGGFANQATLSVSGVPDDSAEACASPVAPTIQKTVAPAVQQSDGSWNVVYTVTVGNSNTAPADLAYTVKDALGFPTGTTINSVAVTGTNASGTFNGTSNQALISGVGRIPASSTRVYTVTVNVSAPVGSVAPADLLCTPTGGGYANTATLYAGTGSTSLGTASACSPVAVAPLPTITKKVVSSSVGTDGNWTLVYQIDVQNTDATYATSYTLNDTLDFATAVSVVSADVTAAPAGVTTNAAWDGAATARIVQNQTLAAGQTDQYQLTVVADPGTLDSTSAAADCRLDSGETGTGFLNVATVAAGVKSAVAEACEPATDPSVVKTVAQQPSQNTSTGVWTVKYQIAVTNKSTTTLGTIAYTVDDTINFPADVQNVTVTAAAGSGGSTPQSNFDGDTHPVLVHGSIGAAADASTPAVQLYTVTVTFTVPAGMSSGVQCVAGQGPGGLQNVGEITVGLRTSGSVACVDLPDVPTPALSKTVTSQKQLADGTWAVNYLITVANPSATSASRYSVDDQLALGAGMTVDSATVTNAPAGVTTAAGWDGQGSTDLVNNILLPAGGTHTYTVHAVIDTGSVKGTSAAADCTRGGGLGNGATLDTGIDTRQSSACVNTFDPGVTKTLDDAPVLQADGSWLLSYTMTVSNPSGVQLSYGLDDTLDFPSGTTTSIVSATGPGARNDWNGGSQSTLVDDGQPLAANAVDQFHVTVRATLPAGQASAANGWKNTATVASGSGGVNTSAATASADVALPHLEVSKSVTANPVIHIGDQVDYTVTVTNSGDGDFTSLYPAAVWDDLSSVLDDATLDAAPVATPNVGLVSTSTAGFDWRGALLHGDSVSLHYSVTTKSGGNADLLNIAFAAAPDATAPATPTVSNCAAPDCASTDTPMPALYVQKHAAELTTTPGGTVHYTVTVTNTGAANIPGTDPATVTDDLSAVLAHASYNGDATVDRGSVTVSGQTLTWTGGLAAGATATIVYSVAVDPGAAMGTSLVNVAISDPTLATLSTGGTAVASQVSVTTMVALLASTGAEVATAIAIAAGLLAGGIFAFVFSLWQRRGGRRRRLVEG